MIAAQAELPVSPSYAQGRRIGVTRLGATAAVVSAVIFVACWVGTFIPFSSPSHAFIGLFTTAGVSSVQALVEGTIWSLLFGALSGALFAAIYNLFAVLERR
jgi:hypothetical protein